MANMPSPKSYRNLIHKIALRHVGNEAGMALGDLEQEGYVAVKKALDDADGDIFRSTAAYLSAVIENHFNILRRSETPTRTRIDPVAGKMVKVKVKFVSLPGDGNDYTADDAVRCQSRCHNEDLAPEAESDAEAIAEADRRAEHIVRCELIAELVPRLPRSMAKAVSLRYGLDGRKPMGLRGICEEIWPSRPVHPQKARRLLAKATDRLREMMGSAAQAVAA